jgi:hypothetical protein
MTTKTEQIRTLNDQLRQNFSEGTAVLTCGIAALGAEAVARIVKTIAIFDDFCHANDPHQEHEFDAAFRYAAPANEGVAGSPTCATASRASRHSAKPDSQSGRQTFRR